VSTGTQAEELVRKWYEDKGQRLLRMEKKETGFDFRTRDDTTYIEVKGTAANRLSAVLFRYLTNSQYDRIKWCLRNNKQY
jgi:phosphoribosylaminoimidazole-succinocarboxamide synthase